MPRKQERCQHATFGEGAKGHLADKMGPCVSREGVWSTKWGLAARERAFGRQNGAPRLAGRRLVDKMGLRVLAKGRSVDEMGNREGMNF